MDSRVKNVALQGLQWVDKKSIIVVKKDVRLLEVFFAKEKKRGSSKRTWNIKTKV